MSKIVYSFEQAQNMMSEGEKRGFNKGAHQAMQETRLEIALGLIKQVDSEEHGAFGLGTAIGSTAASLYMLRNRNRP